MASRWPRFAAAFLGFVWFLQLGGGTTLLPTHVGWIFDGDWRQHWMGWLFFRDEPWTFPLGTLKSLPYPVGTTIGFTDSNPILSLLLKPFSGVLPREVQFIGPWLALCFVLQGYMGAALASTVTKDKGQQVLGGYLFVLSPVLALRLGHDTLCAHWLLLGLLYLGFKAYGDRRAAHASLWWAAAAATYAAGTHPYLAAMALVLAVAVCIRMWRTGFVSLPRALIGAAVATIGTLTMFFVIGYFGDASVASPGFGTYAADLNTLINPHDSSRLMPPMTIRDGGWEGLGFLGLGGLVAVAIGLGLLVRHRPSVPRGVWIVTAASGALGFYALSSHVSLSGQEVMNLEGLYSLFTPVVSAFRASGRFIWPLHYLALLFGIWATTRVFGSARIAAGTTLLAAIVVLQASDMRFDNKWASDKKFRQAPADQLAMARGKFQHLALFPMQILGVCRQPYLEDHAYRFMLLAYRLGLTYNSGIFARLDSQGASRACDQEAESLQKGTLDPQTMYVVEEKFLEDFRAAGAGCGRWDSDWYCVSKDSDARFREYLVTGKLPAQ